MALQVRQTELFELIFYEWKFAFQVQLSLLAECDGLQNVGIVVQHTLLLTYTHTHTNIGHMVLTQGALSLSWWALVQLALG